MERWGLVALPKVIETSTKKPPLFLQLRRRRKRPRPSTSTRLEHSQLLTYQEPPDNPLDNDEGLSSILLSFFLHAYCFEEIVFIARQGEQLEQNIDDK